MYVLLIDGISFSISEVRIWRHCPSPTIDLSPDWPLAHRLSGPSCSSFFFCHQNGHSAKPGRGEFHCHSTGSLAPEDPKEVDRATVRYPRVIWYQKNPREMEETGRRLESGKVDSQCQKCLCVIHESKWEWPTDQVGPKSGSMQLH